MRPLKILLIVSAAALLLVMGGCNALENETTSSSVMIIGAITGSDISGQGGSFIAFSDVLTGGGIINDNGVASLSMMLIDPGAPGATYYQQIIVDQIDIHYTRSDGLNEAGRDVPYPFSQATYVMLEMGAFTELPFILIQHTAKLESPLVDLVDDGQENVLKLEAHITFHGHDVGGHRVQPQTGTISVYCANFADSE